jgi:hypothetical protein
MYKTELFKLLSELIFSKWGFIYGPEQITILQCVIHNAHFRTEQVHEPITFLFPKLKLHLSSSFTLLYIIIPCCWITQHRCNQIILKKHRFFTNYTIFFKLQLFVSDGYVVICNQLNLHKIYDTYVLLKLVLFSSIESNFNHFDLWQHNEIYIVFFT